MVYVGRVNLIIGYVLLGVVIIIQVGFFLIGTFYGVPAFLKTASYATNFNDFCRRTEYTGVCDPVLLYAWIISRIPLRAMIIVNLMVVLTLYILTSRMMNSYIIGGLCALIYSSTPLVLLLDSLDYTGLLFTSSLIVIASLLVFHGFIHEDKNIYLYLGLALYVMGVIHPAAIFSLLVFSAISLIDYVNGNLTKKKWLVLLVMTSINTMSLFIVGYLNYEIFAIPTILIATVVLISSRLLPPFKTAYSHRVVASLIALLFALLLGYLLFIHGNYRSLLITGLKPALTYGISGFLAIPGLMIILRGWKSSLEAYLAVTTLSLMPISVVSQTGILLTTAFLSIVACLFLSRVFNYLKESIYTVSILRRVILFTMLAAFIAIPPFTSIIISASSRNANLMLLNEINDLNRSRRTSLVFGDSLDEIGDEIAGVVESTLLGNSALLIAHWDHICWVQGSLAGRGVDVHIIAHTYSSGPSKTLLSKIMVNKWDTARLIIEKLSKDLGIRDVYVLLIIPYTTNYLNYSYIGFPGSITSPYYQYPVLIYEAYGDLSNIPQYIVLANKSIEDYLYVYQQEYRVQALLWNTNGREMLIAQLSILALHEAGYVNVYNYMIETRPINTTIEGFRLIYHKSVPLGRISVTYYGDYDVYYLIALFKLE